MELFGKMRHLTRDESVKKMNMYRNTHDKSTFIEFCFRYSFNNNYIEWVKNKLLEFDYVKRINRFC